MERRLAFPRHPVNDLRIGPHVPSRRNFTEIEFSKGGLRKEIAGTLDRGDPLAPIAFGREVVEPEARMNLRIRG